MDFYPCLIFIISCIGHQKILLCWILLLFHALYVSKTVHICLCCHLFYEKVLSIGKQSLTVVDIRFSKLPVFTSDLHVIIGNRYFQLFLEVTSSLASASVPKSEWLEFVSSFKVISKAANSALCSRVCTVHFMRQCHASECSFMRTATVSCGRLHGLTQGSGFNLIFVTSSRAS